MHKIFLRKRNDLENVCITNNLRGTPFSKSIMPCGNSVSVSCITISNGFDIKVIP